MAGVSPHYLMPLVPKTHSPIRSLMSGGLAFGAAFLAGCASETVLTPENVPAAALPANDQGYLNGPGVESQDIAAVADAMSRGILGISRIANAKPTPRVVLEPVNNNTGIAVDRAVFLARIRILLNQKSMNKVRFLDQAMMARLESEARPDFRGTDYLLSGEFDPVAPQAPSVPAGSVLTRFRLTDARTNTLVWEGSYAIGADDLAALVATAQ